MRFGHYSNEELGIKRNLTCSMFTEKGVDVGQAKDVECGQKEQIGSITREINNYYTKLQKLQDRINSAIRSAEYPNESLRLLRAIQKEFDRLEKESHDKVAGASQIKGTPDATVLHLKCDRLDDAFYLFGEKLKRMIKEADADSKNKKMSNEIDDAKDVECFLGGNEKGKVSEFCLFNYLERYFGYRNYHTMEDMIEHHVDLIAQDYARQGRSVDSRELRQKAIASLKSLTRDACEIFDRGSNGHCVPEVDKRDFNAKLEKAVDKIMTRRGKKGRGKAAGTSKSKTTKMSNDLDDAKDVECGVKTQGGGRPNPKRKWHTAQRSFDTADPGTLKQFQREYAKLKALTEKCKQARRLNRGVEKAELAVSEQAYHCEQIALKLKGINDAAYFAIKDLEEQAGTYGQAKYTLGRNIRRGKGTATEQELKEDERRRKLREEEKRNRYKLRETK